MRPLYHEFDELDVDFADSVITRHLLQKKLREERRHARRFMLTAGKKRKQKFDDDYDDDYDEYEDYESYDGEYEPEYDDDSYSDRNYD